MKKKKDFRICDDKLCICRCACFKFWSYLQKWKLREFGEKKVLPVYQRKEHTSLNLETLTNTSFHMLLFSTKYWTLKLCKTFVEYLNFTIVYFSVRYKELNSYATPWCSSFAMLVESRSRKIKWTNIATPSAETANSYHVSTVEKTFGEWYN